MYVAPRLMTPETVRCGLQCIQPEPQDENQACNPLTVGLQLAVFPRYGEPMCADGVLHLFTRVA